VIVGEVMEVGPSPVSAATSLQDAARLMRRAGHAPLLVLEADQLVGTLSAWDLSVRGCAEGLAPGQAAVGQVMSRDPVRCSPDLDLREAGGLMRKRGVEALVVCDEEDHPVGVLTLLRVLELLAGPPFARARGPIPETVERVRGDAF
jgi:arabinose-5-phosphate isomerase